MHAHTESCAFLETTNIDWFVGAENACWKSRGVEGRLPAKKPPRVFCESSSRKQYNLHAFLIDSQQIYATSKLPNTSPTASYKHSLQCLLTCQFGSVDKKELVGGRRQKMKVKTNTAASRFT
jgi:hypothetical protein